jgi:uncharacterized RDD family membrane protein YckC
MQFQPSNEFNPYAPPVDSPGMSDAGAEEMQLLAARSTRLGARILDNLVMFAAAVPGLLVLFASGRGEVILGGVIAGLAVLGLVIYQWYLIGTTGQSLGKKWLGIKIVKIDGSSVDFVSGVILRSWITGLMGVIPYIGSFIGLIDALMIFGSEQRCLHDQIASTKVIVVPLRSY